jgi:hypothetical protein
MCHLQHDAAKSICGTGTPIYPISKMKCFQLRILLIFMIHLLVSCGKSELDLAPEKKKEYFLHLSHTYVPGIPEAKIDPQVLRIPLKSYNVVMLGGDITPATTIKVENLKYVDSVFHIRDEKILWSLGNHDYDNPSL